MQTLTDFFALGADGRLGVKQARGAGMGLSVLCGAPSEKLGRAVAAAHLSMCIATYLPRTPTQTCTFGHADGVVLGGEGRKAPALFVCLYAGAGEGTGGGGAAGRRGGRCGDLPQRPLHHPL